MRRSRLVTVAATSCVVALTPAAALAAGGGRPRLSVTPRDVHFGQQQKVSGHQWAVIEFCRRTVRVELVSAQNRVNLGTARIRANGTFTRRWTPRRSAVGAGRWHVRATQRCESGKDGSAIYVRRATPVRIGP
jgi:hypothetical protein